MSVNNKEFGFEYDGIWITDPTISPCGTFEVNPREFYRVNLCGMSDTDLDAWIEDVNWWTEYYENDDVA
ncbi:MAG: hypothetical protein VW270_15485 [Candidatus Poseidoniales archaeon]|jgi:hypothetical protein